MIYDSLIHSVQNVHSHLGCTVSQSSRCEEWSPIISELHWLGRNTCHMTLWQNAGPYWNTYIIINISPVIFNNSLYHTYQALTFHSIQLMHIFQAKTTWHKGINQIIVMWLLVMHARVILRFTSSFTTGHNSWLHSAMGKKRKQNKRKALSDQV